MITEDINDSISVSLHEIFSRNPKLRKQLNIVSNSPHRVPKSIKYKQEDPNPHHQKRKQTKKVVNNSTQGEKLPTLGNSNQNWPELSLIRRRILPKVNNKHIEIENPQYSQPRNQKQRLSDPTVFDGQKSLISSGQGMETSLPHNNKNIVTHEPKLENRKNLERKFEVDQGKTSALFFFRLPQPKTILSKKSQRPVLQSPVFRSKVPRFPELSGSREKNHYTPRTSQHNSFDEQSLTVGFFRDGTMITDDSLESNPDDTAPDKRIHTKIEEPISKRNTKFSFHDKKKILFEKEPFSKGPSIIKNSLRNQNNLILDLAELQGLPRVLEVQGSNTSLSSKPCISPRYNNISSGGNKKNEGAMSPTPNLQNKRRSVVETRNSNEISNLITHKAHTVEDRQFSKTFYAQSPKGLYPQSYKLRKLLK